MGYRLAEKPLREVLETLPAENYQVSSCLGHGWGGWLLEVVQEGPGFLLCRPPLPQTQPMGCQRGPWPRGPAWHRAAPVGGGLSWASCCHPSSGRRRRSHNGGTKPQPQQGLGRCGHRAWTPGCPGEGHRAVRMFRTWVPKVTTRCRRRRHYGGCGPAELTGVVRDWSAQAAVQQIPRASGLNHSVLRLKPKATLWAGWAPAGASLLGVRTPAPHRDLTRPLPWVGIPDVASIRTSPIRLAPTRMASFYPVSSLKVPISKWSQSGVLGIRVSTHGSFWGLDSAHDGCAACVGPAPSLAELPGWTLASG